MTVTAGWSAALLAGGYLIGSFPTAYLLGRWRLDVDVRRIGTGNVGGANLKDLLGTWATVAVGAVDLGKGLLPVWLGLRLGLGKPAAYLAGLAAVAGHDWSIWLGFRGGRGAASTLGALTIAFPPGAAWVLGSLALGAAVRETALLHLLGVASLPVLSFVLGAPARVTVLTAGLATAMVTKRLEANAGFGLQPTLHTGQQLSVTPCRRPRDIIRQRLLYDRESDPASGRGTLSSARGRLGRERR